VNHTITFDPVWEQKYAGGHAQRYPWDVVVSFVFRNAPRDRPRGDVRVFELGFGSGANLWFAAREGFAVAGVEGSASAVAAADRRLADEGLGGDLRVGDFTRPLEFPDGFADLAIDRGALTCVGLGDARAAISEIRRILRPGGVFLFTPFSLRHPASLSGTPAGDGLVRDIRGGHLEDFGQICFYDRAAIDDAFGQGWRFETVEHVTHENASEPGHDRAEWRVVAHRV
jgi:SAM-dependent methyltransferase